MSLFAQDGVPICAKRCPYLRKTVSLILEALGWPSCSLPFSALVPTGWVQVSASWRDTVRPGVSRAGLRTGSASQGGSGCRRDRPAAQASVSWPGVGVHTLSREQGLERSCGVAPFATAWPGGPAGAAEAMFTWLPLEMFTWSMDGCRSFRTVAKVLMAARSLR